MRLDKAKNNPNKHWLTINNITYRTKVQTPVTDLISNSTDSRDAVNHINNFLVNMEENLGENFIKTHTTSNIVVTFYI